MNLDQSSRPRQAHSRGGTTRAGMAAMVTLALATCGTASAATAAKPSGARTTLAGAGGRYPSMSANGGRVAFSTTHALVADDTNGAADLYVRDHPSGSVRRVSVSSTGGQGSGVAVGSVGSVSGYSPRQLSEDGNVAVFVTGDSSLVPPRDVVSTVLQVDVNVFVHDLRTGSTSEVLVDRGSGAAAAIVATVSGDGSTVAWETSPGRVWVQKLATGETVEVGRAGGSTPDGWLAAPSLSRDGRYVAFLSNAPNLSGGSNKSQVHVADLTSGATTMVSRAPTGQAGNAFSGPAEMSADGSVVAFASIATNLTTSPTSTEQVYAHRVPTGLTTIVSSGMSGRGNAVSTIASISPNGRFVGFSSAANNLVAGDTNNDFDVFVRDLQAGTLIRASVTSSGGNANGRSDDSAVADDGRTVAFESEATNLATAPAGSYNLFLRNI